MGPTVRYLIQTTLAPTVVGSPTWQYIICHNITQGGREVGIQSAGLTSSHHSVNIGLQPAC
uniref:Uncharacterized protein n=1 Tax=Anguilla anguilla TaxID=7936 RepID=A0A0E9VUA7_ANGAN